MHNAKSAPSIIAFFIRSSSFIIIIPLSPDVVQRVQRKRNLSLDGPEPGPGDLRGGASRRHLSIASNSWLRLLFRRKSAALSERNHEPASLGVSIEETLIG